MCSKNLIDNKVHVWRINLDAPLSQLYGFKNILSIDEIKRANKFYFEKHRSRFIVHRAFLKKILSYYLNIEASLILFSYDKFGKPYLSPSITNGSLSFSLSHSNNIALVGITNYSPIGIDIEYIRPLNNVELLAKRFFTKKEYEMLIYSPEKEKFFFDIWTLKEAYLKTTGEGLSGLEKVEISFDSEKKTFISYNDIPLLTDCWNIFRFIPAQCYTASLVRKNADSGIDLVK